MQFFDHVVGPDIYEMEDSMTEMEKPVEKDESSKQGSPRRKPRKKLYTDFQLYNPSCRKELETLLASMNRLAISTQEANGQFNNENDSPMIEDTVVNNEPAVKDEIEKEEVEDEQNSNSKPKLKIPCNTCKMYFDSVGEQRDHFKLDWHRYNLKRGHLKQAPVSEEEFSSMLGIHLR